MEPRTSSIWTIVAGLLTATVGIGIVWASGTQFRTIIPPGIVILPMIAVVLAVRRWHWTPMLAVAVALYIVAGVLANDRSIDLAGHRGSGVAVGRWIQLSGLLITTVAGVAWVSLHFGAIRKRKLLSIAGILFGSPIYAEYLQAYLSFDVVFAWFVHLDGRDTYGYVPDRAQVLSVSVVAAGLVLIAFSPIGRPLSSRPRRWTPGRNLTFVVGFIGLAICGLGPPSWEGFAWMCGGDHDRVGECSVVRLLSGLGLGSDNGSGLRVRSRLKR